MIKNDLDGRIKYILKAMPTCDLKKVDVNANDTKGALLFINDLVDKKALGELIIKPLSEFKDKTNEENLFNAFLSPDKKKIYEKKELLSELLSGRAILITEGISCAFSFDVIKPESRAITEPPTSTVIKGPREGFNESLPINVNLIRKRLKTPDLTFINLKVGKYSNTSVSICYVKGICDADLVEKVKKKLMQIDTDAILDSSYVSKFLGDKSTALFKQVGNTEKPDILSAKILEGRIAILVDGSPIALTVPYLLLEDFQSPSDYYGSAYSATLARIIRVISVMISVFLPAFFVAAELFHLQLIPLSFLLTIVNSIKGIPLSPSYEMFFTLLIFEILNEASVRMPKYVGMVVSIVGGLVLGETAVTAGIISAPTLMTVALSGICLYTVPELVQTFSIIRLILLVVAGSFGGYGLLVACSIFIIYLVSFESFSTPICAPYSPFILSDKKDGVYKGFMCEMAKRPLSIRNNNSTRIKFHDKTGLKNGDEK